MLSCPFSLFKDLLFLLLDLSEPMVVLSDLLTAKIKDRSTCTDDSSSLVVNSSTSRLMFAFLFAYSFLFSHCENMTAKLIWSFMLADFLDIAPIGG